MLYDVGTVKRSRFFPDSDVPFVTRPLLLLDNIATTAARAYSLRKLRASYTGSAIRVRRSNDNAEQDIGFTAAGALDTSALSSFVGSNSAFVKTFYDQTTNGDNCTQTTTTTQPRIVNAGANDTKNSLPILLFDGTDDTLQGASSFTCREISAVFALNYATVFADWNGIIAGTAEYGLIGVSGSTHFASPSDSVGLYANTTFLVNGSSSSPPVAIFGGTLQNVSSRDPSGTFTAPLLGSDRNLSNRYLNGWIGEAVLWTAALSTTDRTKVYTDQKTYWGTP